MGLGIPNAIFLSGPISNALSGRGFDPSVRTALEDVAQGLERDGFRILSAHRVEAWGQEIPDTPEHVFRRDWDFVLACDAVVVVLPVDEYGMLYRSDGVFIEIGWAVALGKPLFVVTDRTASGRSYLFEGLLALPACTRVFDSAGGFDVAELSYALRAHFASIRP
jgi:nucleoside 2-deoxyribosyltransferase